MSTHGLACFAPCMCVHAGRCLLLRASTRTLSVRLKAHLVGAGGCPAGLTMSFWLRAVLPSFDYVSLDAHWPVQVRPCLSGFALSCAGLTMAFCMRTVLCSFGHVFGIPSHNYCTLTVTVLFLWVRTVLRRLDHFFVDAPYPARLTVLFCGCALFRKHPKWC
jgi:ABC-type Fe3+-siderophore transport system permease subunit